MRLRFLIFVFLICSWPAVAQDMSRVKQTVADLAAPEMHGRGYVKEGDKKAAAYIRSRFEALKIQPFSGNYFQEFTLEVNTFEDDLELKADGKKLKPGIDFLAHAASAKGEGKAKALYFDSLIFKNESAGQKFLNQKVADKVVIIRQADLDKLVTLPNTFRDHLYTAKALVVLQKKLLSTVARGQLVAPVFEVLESAWPKKVKKISFDVDAEFKSAYKTQNVIGYIKGSVYPDSFLVLTAHYDHLGRQSDDVYFPGANDNASGTAMLLELAHYYAQPENQPEYSVAFMAFGAEEAGLVGSKFYTENPLFPLHQIKFLVNVDLMSTGDEGMMVVNGKIFEPEFKLLTQLNDQKKYLPQLKSRGKAANSDHYHFSEKSVKSFFFYTLGGITHYHNTFDKADTIPFTKFPEVYKLIIDFLGGFVKGFYMLKFIFWLKPEAI